MAIFSFGEFEADEDRFELRRRGRGVRVQRLILETIFYFLRSGGKLITKRELSRATRPGARVSDAAVTRAIMLARRALMDQAGEVIVTVHGVGYRFDCDVREVESRMALEAATTDRASAG
jgi:DNA-binding winged helix-turn-helix (wHTH) protein